MNDRHGEPERSSLDEDAGAGSQGEVDPGSEGDFTGAPMDREPPVPGADAAVEPDDAAGDDQPSA